ncbi:hypothetical protein ACXA18_05710 [Riemerella anatipestifer]|uniref:hypothetical protein n=1 Tax=Riemerella anatipestifer TaxID=34085 RepID=UPI0030C45F20
MVVSPTTSGLIVVELEDQRIELSNRVPHPLPSDLHSVGLHHRLSDVGISILFGPVKL